jgi:hypothetical protein
MGLQHFWQRTGLSPLIQTPQKQVCIKTEKDSSLPSAFKINLNSLSCVKQTAKVQKTWKELLHKPNLKLNKATQSGSQGPQPSA